MSTDAPAPAPGPTESLDSAIVRVLMDTIPDRIYFKDLQSRFVRTNLSQALNIGAASPADCVGKTDYDYFTPDHAAIALADEQEIIRTGRPLINKLEHITTRDGSTAWVSTSKLPWRDQAGRIIGTFGLTRDVTATKVAEDKLLEERNLLRTIIDHLPSRIYVKDTASRYLINNLAHLAMLGLGRQEEATGRTLLDFFPGKRGQLALADDREVITSGVPILSQEKPTTLDNGEVQWALTTKVPLRDVRGRIAGIVGISHDITRRKQAEEELQRRTAEMEADVRMARQLQESFLARPYPIFPVGVPPEASALHFAHSYIPATTLGGDFFDLIQLSDTQCGLLVCDVMGHGVRAGLLTALIRGILEEMGERADQPAQVLSAINHGLCPILEQTGQPMFATAFFAVFDTAASTLAYASAGHPPALLLRPGAGSPERLAFPNPEPATGLIPHFPYTARTTPFGAGDRLIAYTDGLIEAADLAGNLFGEERLTRLLADCGSLHLAAVCAFLIREVQTYSHREILDDDVCIVAVESTGTTCTIEPVNFVI